MASMLKAVVTMDLGHVLRQILKQTLPPPPNHDSLIQDICYSELPRLSVTPLRLVVATSELAPRRAACAGRGCARVQLRWAFLKRDLRELRESWDYKEFMGYVAIISKNSPRCISKLGAF